MRTRWSLHPEIEAGLSLLPPLPFEAAQIGKDAIPAIREAMTRPVGIPDHVRHHELVVDRGAAVPSLRLHVYTPRDPVAQPRSALLWIHGGGYIVGSAKDEARRVAALGPGGVRRRRPRLPAGAGASLSRRAAGLPGRTERDAAAVSRARRRTGPDRASRRERRRRARGRARGALP